MAKIEPLTPGGARSTLVARLGRVANSARQVATNLGARPYRVFLVWTRYGGDERAGSVVASRRVEILPTPLVEGLDGVALSPQHAGVVPLGSMRLTEVNPDLDYQLLRGFRIPAEGEPAVACECLGEVEPEPDDKTWDHVPRNWDFRYEVIEDGRSGIPVPMLFRCASPPVRRAEMLDWSVLLERIGEEGAASEALAALGDDDR